MLGGNTHRVSPEVVDQFTSTPSANGLANGTASTTTNLNNFSTNSSSNSNSSLPSALDNLKIKSPVVSNVTSSSSNPAIALTSPQLASVVSKPGYPTTTTAPPSTTTANTTTTTSTTTGTTTATPPLPSTLSAPPSASLTPPPHAPTLSKSLMNPINAMADNNNNNSSSNRNNSPPMYDKSTVKALTQFRLTQSMASVTTFTKVKPRHPLLEWFTSWTKTKKKHMLTPQQQVELYSPIRRQCFELLENKMFTVVMLLLTFYTLFGDDVRLSVAHRGSDNTFYSLATICLTMFAFEFVLSCYARPQYLCSFYFLLDMIATLSILPDIGWIWNTLVNVFGGSSAAIKATKATRAGSKAGRIVRVVRAVRLFRVVKIIKWKHRDEDANVQLQESRVGSKMGELTVQRVVVLVLALVMVLPIFDGGYSTQELLYQDMGLRALHVMTSSTRVDNNREYALLLEGYVRDAGKLLYMELSNRTQEELYADIQAIRFQPSDDLSSPHTLTENPSNGWSFAANMYSSINSISNDFRDVELNVVNQYGCYVSEFVTWDAPTASSQCHSVAYFDVSSTSSTSASYNILKTAFIIVVLILASTLFIRVTRVLVLEPIERMMIIVHRLARDPLARVKTMGDEETIRKNAKEEGFETALLEITLSKVGQLMQVGFGAAGADVIGKNMGSGDLDPMLPGKKITAIYGFCDIRQFTDTTECLQEDVMVYVNKLGFIMHGGTHNYYGMANKNVGDAFLLSWKICDGELSCFARFTDTPTEEDRIQVNQIVRCPAHAGAGQKLRRLTPTEMADSALTAFIKCMIDLDNANTDGPLTEYLKRDNVIRRFGTSFRIKMGFGMHVGWAVEGAIGSRFKIDATYISPHVEMADRLEAGSKMFGTPINLSHWFAALLSPAARSFLRKMDRMSVRGVDTPLTVYTFDVTVPKKGFGTPRIDPSTGYQTPVDFENDVEYQEIREGLEPAFLESASSAVEAYLAGDWPKARHYLAHAQHIRPNDGPCKHLMGILREHNFEAPPDWKGYRSVSGY